MKFQFCFFVVASLIAAAMSATVADIITDINRLSNQVTALNAAVKALPGPTAFSKKIAAIHMGARRLTSSITKSTKDIKSVSIPVSEADGGEILKLVQEFQPTLVDTLSRFATNKPTLSAMGNADALTLIKNDLIGLNATTTEFDSALLEAVPVDLVPAATQIKNTFDAAFASAIAVYS